MATEKPPQSQVTIDLPSNIVENIVLKLIEAGIKVAQNLIKRQSKGVAKNSNVIFSAPDYSEIEMLEQVLVLYKFF